MGLPKPIKSTKTPIKNNPLPLNVPKFLFFTAILTLSALFPCHCPTCWFNWLLSVKTALNRVKGKFRCSCSLVRVPRLVGSGPPFGVLLILKPVACFEFLRIAGWIVFALTVWVYGSWARYCTSIAVIGEIWAVCGLYIHYYAMDGSGPKGNVIKFRLPGIAFGF